MIEKKCFVSPEDIIAVQFKCANCGSATIVPIDKLVSGDLGFLLTNACRHCRAQTGFVHGSNDLARMIDFNSVLGGLTRLLDAKGIKYSFQVECPE